MDKKQEGETPPYLSFEVFQAALSHLRKVDLPPVIDGNALNFLSEGDRWAVISSFKFLGLSDDDGKPQDSLKRLLSVKQNSDEEKSILKQIFKDKYSKVLTLNLSNTNKEQLEKAIATNYRAGKSTVKRAGRFFVKAALYLDIPVSRNLTKGMRPPSFIFTKKKQNKNQGRSIASRRQPASQPSHELGQETMNGESVSIKLKTGSCRLTLTVSGAILSVEPQDREFVFGLVDKLKQYEQGETNQEQGGINQERKPGLFK